MPSPFPGIDPYLEAQGDWPDFHPRFINYWCEAIAERLPSGYEARLDERVNLIDLPTGRPKRIGPDAAVVRRGPAGAPAAGAQGAATLEPVVLPLLIEEEVRQTYVEILHRPDRTLVAVLELLSPSNKEEPGRGLYLAKRNALLRGPIHLVELDLLLGGRRLPLAGAYPPGDCYGVVCRADRRPNAEVYAWSVRRPLPALPVPLKAPDGDAWVDLGLVYAVAYEKGRYARSVDYAASPPDGLSADAVQWVSDRARSAPPP